MRFGRSEKPGFSGGEIARVYRGLTVLGLL
jgi:hypothetical protein